MERKILTAPDGFRYCNYEDKIIASVVYLAEGADPNKWFLIDEEEKNKLAAQWEAEMTNEMESLDNNN